MVGEGESDRVKKTYWQVISLLYDPVSFRELSLSKISTQHIPTLLVQHLQARAKRSKQLNATYRNIVRGTMLCAFGHPVVMCCYMLGHMRGRNIVGRIWPNDRIIMQHPQMLHEKFDRLSRLIQQHLTPRNMS